MAICSGRLVEPSSDNCAVCHYVCRCATGSAQLRPVQRIASAGDAAPSACDRTGPGGGRRMHATVAPGHRTARRARIAHCGGHKRTRYTSPVSPTHSPRNERRHGMIPDSLRKIKVYLSVTAKIYLFEMCHIRRIKHGKMK